ncbi:hypothetical protein N2382_09185 [SAR92 clade bacterium H921]|nr:hypothetical protein [SAR92 clade bacterium H921]
MRRSSCSVEAGRGVECSRRRLGCARGVRCIKRGDSRLRRVESRRCRELCVVTRDSCVSGVEC